MNLLLNTGLGTEYKSATQKVRVLTEHWVAENLYCPACTGALLRAPTNAPVLDFHCENCSERFELKAKKGRFGTKVVDGAYATMRKTIESSNHPSFLLLGYGGDLMVENLIAVPRRFIVPTVIEKRKPLSGSARRAGWVGCNLLLSEIPEEGRLYLIRDRWISEQANVIEQWAKSAFLDEFDSSVRGWLIAVLNCAQRLRKQEFSLQEMYGFVPHLQGLFPDNRHVRAKIRQQLQVLRDLGRIEFLGNGRYRVL